MLCFLLVSPQYSSLTVPEEGALCCSGSRRLRNRLSSSITPAGHFTTSLSTTSHSPRTRYSCQTDLNAPTAAERPLLTRSPPQHELPPYVVPAAPHDLSQGRVCPKSIATQPPQLRDLCSRCLRHAKPVGGDVSSLDAVLPAASRCLPAQTSSTPQALPVSQNPSREPPASRLPFPVSQPPPPPAANGASAPRCPPPNSHPASPPAPTAHPQRLARLPAAHRLSVAHRPRAKRSGVKREETPFSSPGSKHVFTGRCFSTGDTSNSWFGLVH